MVHSTPTEDQPSVTHYLPVLCQEPDCRLLTDPIESSPYHHTLCKMHFNIIVRLPRGIIYSAKYFVRLFFVTLSYSCYNSRPSCFLRFNLCAGPKVFPPVYSWPYCCPHPIPFHSYFIFCQQSSFFLQKWTSFLCFYALISYI
jgi:hypothetical protein